MGEDLSPIDDRGPSKRIRFRNYVPHNDKLLALMDSDPNSENPPPLLLTPSQILRAEIEASKESEGEGEEEAVVAPKKPNWDLKNQVQGRLARLQRRTQRAIVDILREKMALENAE